MMGARRWREASLVLLFQSGPFHKAKEARRRRLLVAAFETWVCPSLNFAVIADLERQLSLLGDHSNTRGVSQVSILLVCVLASAERRLTAVASPRASPLNYSHHPCKVDESLSSTLISFDSSLRPSTPPLPPLTPAPTFQRRHHSQHASDDLWGNFATGTTD